MTIKEAKEILDAKTFDTKIDAHVELTEWGKAKSFFKAYRMAKRSLEAWGKVIERLTKMANDKWNEQVGSSKGLNDAIEVIEDILSEVEDEQTER